MFVQHTGRASRRRADAHNGSVLREATCGLADVSVGEANRREPNTRRRNLVTGKYNEDAMQPDEALSDRVLSNRHKSQIASKGKFWCSGCDRNRVGQWGKCSVCGYRECPKKIKVRS